VQELEPESVAASLLRYTKRAGGGERLGIDLNALQTMLGTTSDQVVDSKAILKFGKQLDQIRKARG